MVASLSSLAQWPRSVASLDGVERFVTGHIHAGHVPLGEIAWRYSGGTRQC